MCHAINNFNLQNSIFINKSKPINTLFCFAFPQKRPVDSTSYAIPLNLCDYHFSLALYAYKLKRFVGIHLLSVCTSPSVVIVSALCQPNRFIMSNTELTIRLSEIEELARPHCKIKDPHRVEQILNEIVKGGSNELQVAVILLFFFFCLILSNIELKIWF